MDYLILFASAFAAASILPFYSEITLTYLLTQEYSLFVLWAVATAGNTLGALLNWLLGKYLLHFESRPWFPFKQQKLGLAQRWFQRYGVWSLLLAWLPVGGDALTFIAGIMRVSVVPFLLLVAIGKGARYAVVIYIFLKVF